MKFLALVCIIAACGIFVSGEGFSSGDLYSGSGAAPSTATTTTSSSNEIPFAEATVEADRHFDMVNHGNKKQIVKRHGLKPDHRSKSLFRGMEDLQLNNEASVARFEETVSEADLISMLEFGAGPNWNDYYELPEGELSLLEMAELSAELNDRNIRAAYEMETRSHGNWFGSYKKGPGICFCHGTANKYYTEAEAAKGQNKDDTEFKGYPFWGNRMFKFGGIPFGHDNNNDFSSHNQNPYHHRDCVLTTEEYKDSSYKHCCVGFCAINPVAPYGNIQSTVVPTLFQCDQETTDNLNGRTIAKMNEFMCERPCHTDDCTCEEVEAAIVNKAKAPYNDPDCACAERVANNNNCQCATDNNGGIDWDSLNCDCTLLLEDTPSTGEYPCTCTEGMYNRGCNCGDTTSTGKTFEYIDDAFSCGCDDWFSGGIRQSCSCDLALNLCDGSCCDFYDETASDCSDEVHASFIGAQVFAPTCECDNNAALAV